MFKPLDMNELKTIVRMQLDRVSKTLEKNDVTLHANDKAVSLIAEQSFDPQFGARPLKRTIQRSVLNELSKRILDGTISKTAAIRLTVKDGQLAFVNE